jgi:Rad3-related DNA helicase
LASTNYAYALSSAIHSEGTGPTSILICDEAHQLVQEVCSAIEVRLNHYHNNSLYNTLQSFPPYGKPISHWRTWAKFLHPKVQSHLKSIKESNNHKGLATVDALAFSIERLANVPESWILDESGKDETLVSPLWPTDHTHKYLFKEVPKVLLVSATVVPKTLQLLGVKEEESLFLSQDHTFDPSRCPVYLYGPCRVDHKMSDGQWQEVIGRMDMLIERRLDRKGLIHPVSYQRQDDILRATRNRSLMIAPRNAGELKAAIEEFRQAKPPAILISPAITTGYDFPYDSAEFQIVIKVPFIDSRSPVMKARNDADPEYLNYLTAQTLTQEIGRIMRSHDDRGETIILDQHAGWFFKKHRDLFPPWFMRQVRYANEPPAPPPPLSLAA